MIKIGQLRRWHDDLPSALHECSGKIFLVVGLFTATDEETYVDYVMDDERDWDDIEWVEQGSEVISEEG